MPQKYYIVISPEQTPEGELDYESHLATPAERVAVHTKHFTRASCAKGVHSKFSISQRVLQLNNLQENPQQSF